MRKAFILIFTFGVALCVCAQTNVIFTRLLSFDGTNGADPYAGLTVGIDGNLYGTTCRGGKYNKGTIFKLTPDGILATLFSFDGTNGWSPGSELVQARDEKLYGVCDIAGVFRIATDGSGFTSLHRFNQVQTPSCGLTLGADGNLYGYEPFGGTGNNGAIFRITPSGEFQTVLSCDVQTGSGCSGLVLGRDGNFYGTMDFGGKDFTGNFFRLTTNGGFTVLASFNETNNILVSRNKLVQGTDGDFYGTTEFGGAYNNRPVDNDHVGDGTLFKVSTNGVVTELASFTGWNGAHPRGQLVQTRDGSFYGVTAHDMPLVIAQPRFDMRPTIPDADYTSGTIFRATTNGLITKLFSFTGRYSEYAMTNGYGPNGLAEDSNGNYYGTTALGGEKAHLAGYANGTVFKFRLSP